MATKKKSETELTSKEIEKGAIVTEPASARQYRTGTWRSQRPILDKEQCTKCGLCYIFCPEGCIEQTEDGYYVPDLYYCKGCGICAAECPKKAFKMAEEVES
ncbi:MAG: 4Fe-4S binding protein [Chloroflexota bacterium]